jgi:hypothetical protein
LDGRRGEKLGKLDDVISMAVVVLAVSPIAIDCIPKSEFHESLLSEDVSIVIGVDKDNDSDVAALGDMGI